MAATCGSNIVSAWAIEAPAVRVVVPVGPVALRDDGADAPAVGVVDPRLLRLGARDNRGHGSDRRGQDDGS